jgi:hypothetical protein
VFEGTYDKPFILDSGTRRFLRFNLDAVQSAVHLADPYTLSLADSFIQLRISRQMLSVVAAGVLLLASTM